MAGGLVREPASDARDLDEWARLGTEHRDRATAETLSPRDADDVGEVEFAFGIIAVEGIDKIDGMTRLDRHDAAVDKSDGPFFRGGVDGLDDALEPAVGAENKPAVGAGIGGTHARDQDRGPRLWALR